MLGKLTLGPAPLLRATERGAKASGRGGTHLVVVHHGDVHGWLLGLAEVGDRILLGARHAAGGQDLIVLVHAQRLSPQVLHGQGLAAGAEGQGGRQDPQGAAGYGCGLGQAVGLTQAVLGPFVSPRPLSVRSVAGGPVGARLG